MPTLELADALPDFGTAKTLPEKNGTEQHGPAAVQCQAPQSPPHEQDARKTADAVAEAEAAVTERLEREYEEKLTAERQRHAQELEELQKQLGQKAGETIAARFAEMEQRTVAVTTALTARILGIALTDELQNRAVERLAEIIAQAMKGREAVRISVHGTAFLCDELRKTLGERAGQVDFVESPGLDLSVNIDENIVETRLAEWSETLSEVLS